MGIHLLIHYSTGDLNIQPITRSTFQHERLANTERMLSKRRASSIKSHVAPISVLRRTVQIFGEGVN